MIPHKEWFQTYHKGHFCRIFIIDSYPYDVVGGGTMRVKIKDGRSNIIVNVTYILQLTKNFLPIGQLVDEGYKASFAKDYYKLVNNEMDLIQGICSNLTEEGSKMTSKIILWNKRMANMDKKSLKGMCSK